MQAEGKLSLVEKVRRWPADLKEYFQELQNEMRRVTWPSRKQVQATTAVVIVTVFMFAAYFAVVDQVMTQTVGKIFQVFTR
jgi:preprotein translocase subunit SecE